MNSNNSDKIWMVGDRNRRDKYASSFSQLCITLAGFTGAFFVLIISVSVSSPSVCKELSLIFLMVACFGYAVAATWFTNSLYQKDPPSGRIAHLARDTFLVCNVLAWFGLSLLLLSAEFYFATCISIVLVVCAAIFFFKRSKHRD